MTKLQKFVITNIYKAKCATFGRLVTWWHILNAVVKLVTIRKILVFVLAKLHSTSPSTFNT
jgi:hypothetical protein